MVDANAMTYHTSILKSEVWGTREAGGKTRGEERGTLFIMVSSSNGAIIELVSALSDSSSSKRPCHDVTA